MTHSRMKVIYMQLLEDSLIKGLNGMKIYRISKKLPFKTQDQDPDPYVSPLTDEEDETDDEDDDDPGEGRSRE